MSETVRAFEQGDRLAVRRLGWEPLHRALHTWWPQPNPPADAAVMRAYAEALGDEDPAAVMKALRALAGRWRPGPAEIRGWLNAKRADPRSVDVGRARDRSMESDALAAVAAAIDAGEQPCSCGVRRSTWRRAANWVLRCVECGGLEHGQVYAVEDMQEAA